MEVGGRDGEGGDYEGGGASLREPYLAPPAHT
jgi:hypothetical protein